jgi:alkanesulfonate monooxygenase SsuD/methylene tetrahydromethanopterin reductase-like flavin-dependent oxidoreductase (luciferase family)
MSERRQLSLNFFIYPDGHHEAAWRHRASTANRILDVTYYQELAQRAEAHKFDAVFFADGPALADNVRYASVSGSSRSPCSPQSLPPRGASV